MIRTIAPKPAHGVAVFLLLAACAVQYASGDAGDKEWQLYAARRLITGHPLYVANFFDINTPLLVWIYAIPSFIALHMPFFSDTALLMLFGFAVIACVIRLSVRLIALNPAFTTLSQRMEFALLLAFVFLFFTNPGYFFHREQLFLLLVFPYLLRFMPSLARVKLPPALSLLLGVMAGIGFSLKPHCLLVFAGAQAVIMLRERGAFILFSLENLCIYALTLLYYGAVGYFTPDYYRVVLPMALATYGATNRRLMGLIYLATELFLFALPLADFRFGHPSPYRRDIFYWAALFGLFLVYGLANNGWGYTYNPANSVALIMTGFLFLEYRFLKRQQAAKGEPVRPFVFGIRACGMVFACNAACVFCVVAQIYLLPCASDSECTMQDALVREVTRDGRTHSFSTVSIDFSKWVHLTRQTAAPWASRFHHLWMLPKFLGAGEAFRQSHQWILDYVGNALAEELNAGQPEIVFVDDTDSFYSVHRRIDLIGYLSRMPAFAHAFASYRFAYSIDQCKGKIRNECKYDVYRRIAK